MSDEKGELSNGKAPLHIVSHSNIPKKDREVIHHNSVGLYFYLFLELTLW